MGLIALFVAVVHLIVYRVARPEDFGANQQILPNDFEPLGWIVYIGVHIAMWWAAIASAFTEYGTLDRRRPHFQHDQHEGVPVWHSRLGFLVAGLIYASLYFIRLQGWYSETGGSELAKSAWLIPWLGWFIGQLYFATLSLVCIGYSIHLNWSLSGMLIAATAVVVSYILGPMLTSTYRAWQLGLIALPVIVMTTVGSFSLCGLLLRGFQQSRELAKQKAEQSRSWRAQCESQRLLEQESLKKANLLAEQRNKDDEQRKQEQERKEHELHLQELARRKAAEEQAAREAAVKQREQERFDRAHKVRCCTTCQKAYPDFVLPRCPWCHSESNQRLEAVYDALPPGTEDPSSFPDLQAQLEQKEQLGDFVGAGNLLLDLALRLDPRHVWTAVTAARRLVAAKYEIPPELEYGMPHRDRYLHTKGHRTPQDHGPQLIVFAYVLGATRRTLPAPHDRLLGYYVYLTDLQRQELDTIVDAYARRPRGKTTYSPNDI